MAKNVCEFYFYWLPVNKFEWLALNKYELQKKWIVFSTVFFSSSIVARFFFTSFNVWGEEVKSDGEKNSYWASLLLDKVYNTICTMCSVYCSNTSREHPKLIAIVIVVAIVVVNERQLITQKTICCDCMTFSVFSIKVILFHFFHSIKKTMIYWLSTKTKYFFYIFCSFFSSLIFRIERNFSNILE